MCEFRANIHGEYRPDPVWTIFGTELPVQDGVMRPRLFGKSLFDYLSMSVDDAIESRNFLIRAVAVLDRRIGKRRLEAMSLRTDEHELVRLFYKLRLEAEGLRSGDGRRRTG